MLRAFVNCAKVLTKRLGFLIQVRNKYSAQPSKWLYNCQFKNKEALANFKGLSEDGGRADFSENLPGLSLK
jgi:hypothetical protein